MGIFQRILKHTQSPSTAKYAKLICHHLFTKEQINASDLDALIGLGDEAIEIFRRTLEKHNDAQGLARREQIVDMLGKANNIEKTHPSNAMTIALLASFIDDQTGTVGCKAVTYLATYGSQSNKLLRNALKAKHCRTRSYAARILGQCADQHAIPLLISALNDNDIRVRSDAAEALGKMNALQSTQALLDTLFDSNWMVRDSASTALIKFNAQCLMDQLALWICDQNPQTRIQAIRIMQHIGGTTVIPLLVSALGDVYLEVQYQAIDALASHHNNTAIIALLRQYRTGNQKLRQHITANCNNINIQRVAAQLSHNDTHIRSAAAQLLLQHGDTNLLPLLTNAWPYEHDSDVQMWIVIAIGGLAGMAGNSCPESSIKLLFHASKSSHENISYHAIKALESLNHPLAKQLIQPILQVSKIAINCPSCLQTLQLTPPLTEKEWHCSHCYLGFRIQTGLGRELLVSPITNSRQDSSPIVHGEAWFDVLQIPPEADLIVIKGAFRNLIKQYHPDKVAMLGAEFKQLAEQKSRLLTWALRCGLKEHK
ncbi:MAG: HEAT repeat domain-containing protein [Mariprofundus sp.]|nr:HEAT repeat domain-containing protein [Mariprofundus sp.]